MKVSSKRLFFRDLPPNISEEDINEKFSKYGEVTAIAIKQRKNMTVKNKFPTYAFVNINVDNYKLQECFADIAKNKWKGNFVELQIAKQNFLERLQEEREQDGRCTLQNVIGMPSKETFNTEPTTMNSSNEERTFLKKKRKLASDFETVVNEEMPLNQNTKKSQNMVVKKAHNKNYITNNVTNEDELPLTKDKLLTSHSEDSFNAEIHPHEYNRHLQEIDKDLETVSNGYVDTKVNNFSKIAEEKRLKSISKMKKSYQKQKDAIKIALMNVDTNSCKKIVFNDKDDIQQNEAQSTAIKDYISKEYHLNSHKKALFGKDEDDEDEPAYNFEVKEQFQGKKGKKLMELQLKFKSDKRFAMDEQFLEDVNEELSSDEVQERINVQTKIDCPEIENDILITAEEKQKELSILENVLGKKLLRKGQESQTKKNQKAVSMMRYDPAKPEHSKFILKENEFIKEKSQKIKTNEHKSDRIEIEKPIVSKEVFYKVQDNLKETLQEDKSFSLLSMFSSHQRSDNEQQDNDIALDTHIKEKECLINIKEKNPFRYDSSDESDGEEEIVAEENESEVVENKPTEPKVSLGPTRLWTEPFFFKVDDYRLQEGIDFVRRFELDDISEFKQIRRNIKEIIRAKVRNNERKNRHFKKKIGGKQMVKLRKAMKNR